MCGGGSGPGLGGFWGRGKSFPDKVTGSWVCCCTWPPEGTRGRDLRPPRLLPPTLPFCTASMRTPYVAALRPLAIWGRACSSESTRGTVRPETPSGASISGKATGDAVSRGSQVFPSLPGVDGRDLLLCLFPLCTEPGEPPTVHEDSFLGEGGVSGWDQGGLERDPERCQG